MVNSSDSVVCYLLKDAIFTINLLLNDYLFNSECFYYQTVGTALRNKTLSHRETVIINRL